MKPAAHFIRNEGSDFYIYTPSRTALHTFLYPLRTGLYHYDKGYKLERSSYDSFLIMAIQEGSVSITTESGTRLAISGNFVLLDCSAPHEYEMLEDSTVLWLHFDGITARPHFEVINSKLGSVFSLKNPSYAIARLTNIYDIFHHNMRVSEPQMEQYITDILAEFIIGANSDDHTSQPYKPHVIEETLTYISNHLKEPLTVEELARQAFMSEYHFIRVFKKETGYTPYAYVLNARTHMAKYLLANSDIPLKQLCEECGFSSTSAFCNAFKRKNGISPLEFRRQSAIQ